MSPSKFLVKLKVRMDFGKKPSVFQAKTDQSLGSHSLGQPGAASSQEQPGQAQILADQCSGRDRKHQIYYEMGRESTVWPETKAK